jgi:hypothetical protein
MERSSEAPEALNLPSLAIHGVEGPDFSLNDLFGLPSERIEA